MEQPWSEERRKHPRKSLSIDTENPASGSWFHETIYDDSGNKLVHAAVAEALSDIKDYLTTGDSTELSDMGNSGESDDVQPMSDVPYHPFEVLDTRSVGAESLEEERMKGQERENEVEPPPSPIISPDPVLDEKYDKICKSLFGMSGNELMKKSIDEISSSDAEELDLATTSLLHSDQNASKARPEGSDLDALRPAARPTVLPALVHRPAMAEETIEGKDPC